MTHPDDLAGPDLKFERGAALLAAAVENAAWRGAACRGAIGARVSGAGAWSNKVDADDGGHVCRGAPLSWLLLSDRCLVRRAGSI